METEGYVFHDGGRSLAGYKGRTNDCVTRAIAIVTNTSYSEVYKTIKQITGESPAKGLYKDHTYKAIQHFGGVWIPTMKFGSGCKVHLHPNELPKGKLIASVSRHVVAVIDGIVYDNHDSRRNGRRCVYGYWKF